jgi:hypothetical protein
MPGYRLPEPSLLRSHPPTEQRIARLRELEGRAAAPAPMLDDAVPWPGERTWGCAATARPCARLLVLTRGGLRAC